MHDRESSVLSCEHIYYSQKINKETINNGLKIEVHYGVVTFTMPRVHYR